MNCQGENAELTQRSRSKRCLESLIIGNRIVFHRCLQPIWVLSQWWSTDLKPEDCILKVQLSLCSYISRNYNVRVKFVTIWEVHVTKTETVFPKEKKKVSCSLCCAPSKVLHYNHSEQGDWAVWTFMWEKERKGKWKDTTAVGESDWLPSFQKAVMGSFIDLDISLNVSAKCHVMWQTEAPRPRVTTLCFSASLSPTVSIVFFKKNPYK